MSGRSLKPEALASVPSFCLSRTSDFVLAPPSGASTTAEMGHSIHLQYLSSEEHRPSHENAVRVLAHIHPDNRR